MSMTVNGVCTTTAPGSEKYETFRRRTPNGKMQTYYQYDYRHTDGLLFSCVRTSLASCRDERDAWLRVKKQ